MKARVWGTAGAVLAGAALVVGSHVPVTAHRDAFAVIRVSWSARPERIETCRRLSDEELEKVLEHMRRRVVCEGTTARYQFDIRRDGVSIDSGTVRGGGLRHDREVYMARELSMPPGPARITVRFVRLDSSITVVGGDEARAEQGREDDERRRRLAEAIPPVLSIDTTVTLAPRAVVLVTYDAQGRKLVLRDRP